MEKLQQNRIQDIEHIIIKPSNHKIYKGLEDLNNKILDL